MRRENKGAIMAGGSTGGFCGSFSDARATLPLSVTTSSGSMGTDPADSVCDSFVQTHDHENLFVAGSLTLPNAGCTNGTLTFVALTLRSAERIAGKLRKPA